MDITVGMAQLTGFACQASRNYANDLTMESSRCLQMSHRLGKSGLAVSGKSAAAAAIRAASQPDPLPSAGSKRRLKPTPGSPEQSHKKGKKRKVAGPDAEEATASEAAPESAKAGGAKRGRPPRHIAEGGTTTPEHAHKLKVKMASASEASCLQCHVSFESIGHAGHL